MKLMWTRSIDFVLNNDNVTLMGINECQAWFSVTSNTNVYDSQKFPFAFIGQLMLSEKLLIVDHAGLHRIADKLSDSLQGNCIIMNNSGRCGSTLLCQMFQRVPNTLVMSEPWALLYLHQMYNMKKISWGGYKKLLASSTKIQFKPTMQSRTERYVLKLPLLCASTMKPISDIFGNAIKFMFSTRQPKPSILSFVKVVSSFEPEPLHIRGDFWFSGIGMPYGQKHQGLFDKYYSRRRELTYAEAIAVAYAACIAGFLENKRMYKISIIYEEMIASAHEKTLDMFRALDIPTEYVDNSMKALSTHSQNKMFDNSHVKPDNELVSKEEWSSIDNIFNAINIPIDTSATLFDLVEKIR